MNPTKQIQVRHIYMVIAEQVTIESIGYPPRVVVARLNDVVMEINHPPFSLGPKATIRETSRDR